MIVGILLIFLLGFSISAYLIRKKAVEEISCVKDMSDKHYELFKLMNQWVRVKQQKKSVGDYLKQKGYCNIAIYGMSYVGDTLINELEESDINIKYGVDKKIDYKWREFKVYSLQDKLEQVDAVIVTAITYYEEIKREVSKKLNCPIISLEDILYDI